MNHRSASQVPFSLASLLMRRRRSSITMGLSVLVGIASFGASFGARLGASFNADGQAGCQVACQADQQANGESGLAALIRFGKAVRAELPPGSYDSLRASAPEAVVIEVVAVTRRAGGQGVTQITVQARVLAVERSATGLKKGDVVGLTYPIDRRGVPGPRPLSLLEKNGIYPAFLRKVPGGKTYEPSAYGESFRMTPEP